MSDIILGKTFTSPQLRDAIHIAVVPLIAGEDLARGCSFRLGLGSTEIAYDGSYNKPDDDTEMCPDDNDDEFIPIRSSNYARQPRDNDSIGIVDPFLSAYEVKKGQRFWGILYPGTVTGMRHEWQHPAFINVLPASKDEHEQWLRDFCDRWNFTSFTELIDSALNANPNEDTWITALGNDLHDEGDLNPGEAADFWMHLEAYTGKQFDESHRKNMQWSCSC